MRTTIIGEVGECFNGNIDTAKQMIREIKSAGCDIVKFQLLDMEEVANDDPEREWFQKLELTPQKMKVLIHCARQENIGILFSPVSVKTCMWIHELGGNAVKIASSFLKKKNLISYINEKFNQVYVSTGMAQIQEVRQVIGQLDKIEKISILHCISEYPTGPLLQKRGLRALDEKDVHLNMMLMLKEEFPEYEVGYSDHTDNIFVPIIASAMGASIIEKHVTLDRKTPIDHFVNKLEYMGTDHVLSVEPDMLRQMVSEIRRVEKVKGNYIWERSEGENILRQFLRGRYSEENI